MGVTVWVECSTHFSSYCSLEYWGYRSRVLENLNLNVRDFHSAARLAFLWLFFACPAREVRCQLSRPKTKDVYSPFKVYLVAVRQGVPKAIASRDVEFEN